ncbi:MAG: Multi-sensor hybrid histidine kinase [Candidatus Magnetoglobus multicellularis str. Araruama]|uniref:Sensory/regulatory protein RpfC n=1 Tax=Candidatus Magnetoglobus multicellularis str. Araruama TaxID=890399 RepID=A0A1V1PB71_9BACT|nr:MAG: Multi-sensor hybrid histidine kinase [Candidatus Magnetoglobus multicellularis str. Araruama]
MEKDVSKLIEELDISYMELELQNQVLQETQRKLEISQHYYNELFHYSPIGYMTLNSHGIITDLNLNAAKTLGWNIEQLKGLRLHMFVPVNSFVTYDKCLQALLSKRESQSCEIQVNANGANTRWVRLTFWLHDSGQNVDLSILCSVVDATKEKEVEEFLKKNNSLLEQQVRERTRDLVKARERAEALSKTKDQFLANMSHEIRTPMNGIMGIAQMLQKTDLNPQQHEYVQTIMGSSETLMTIINDILDLSKVEAGKLVLASEPLDIRAVIDNVVKVLSTKVYEKHLEFASIISAKIPRYFYGDSVRISQILMNLLGNAIKFTNSGEILLHATLVNITDNNATIRFEISDTGIGIPDSQKEMLFEPFSQIADNMLKKNVGTGLGLTISQKIARMMGGDIDFESIYTKGTTFWVTIQLKRCEPKDMPSHNYPKYRILLIDNYHHRRTVFREHLNLLNMTFDETSSIINGQAMLIDAMQSKTPYDYCFVDPDLPIEKDFLFWQWLEKNPAQHTRMIATISPMVPEVVYSDIFFDQITKPVTYTGLCRVFKQESQSGHQKEKLDHQTQKEAHALKTILVVEDDPINQKVLQGILKQENFQVMHAFNGQEAIDLLEKMQCDLIFMDMLMPELNGLDTTKIIRDPQSRVLDHNVPIIAMTANAMSIHRQSCFDVGMNDFLTKPVSIKDVMAGVYKILFPNQNKISDLPINNKNDTSDHGLFNKAEMISRLDGNMPLIDETIKLFIKNIPILLEKLQKAIEIGDVMDMEIRAHTIKGNAINIGAESLREMAQKMESAARKGDIQKAESLMPSLTKLCHRISHYLQNETIS